MILNPSQSCGMCKYYKSGFCSEKNGAYGYCEKHYTDVHTSLVCKDIEIDYKKFCYSVACLSLYKENPEEYHEQRKEEEL